MNREEKIKLIQDYTECFNKAKEQGREVNVFDYVDSLEMNKEKAIDIIQATIKQCGFNHSPNNQIGLALQFAIDYMKKSEDEGEVIGWVNYYPEHSGVVISELYTNLSIAKDCQSTNRGTCIQIPIMKPK